MVTIKVIVKDKNFKDKELKRIQAMAEMDTELLAKECETTIRTTINNKTASGTGSLANAEGWTAEPILGGWGVGDIDKLNTEVNYWRHQNYGSQGIDANWEHFLPKGFWANGRWVVSEQGYAGIKPKAPIPPLNYIEETLLIMDSLLPKILGKNK